MHSVIELSKIAPFLNHPLVLTGFVLFLLFGLFQALLRAGLIPIVTQKAGAGILHLILKYGFSIALVTVLLGFTLQGIKTYYAHKEAEETAIQKTYTSRADAALSRLLQEVGNNLSTIGLIISTIDEDQSLSPFGKYERRRINETEPAYIERSRNHYRDYYSQIKAIVDRTPISDNAWTAHQNEILTFGVEYFEKIEQIMHHVSWAEDFIQRYLADVQHIISLQLSDSESYARIISARTEKMAGVRIEICNALALIETVVRENEDLFPFQLALESADIKGVVLTRDEAGRKHLIEKSAEYHKVKAQAIQVATATIQDASEKDISRIVNDPYLKLLRRTMGMSENLTEADVYHLKNKTVDPEDKDFSRLLVLASGSFIEGDGEEAIMYLERAKKLTHLSQHIQIYLDASLHRLKHPEIFGESLGYMVMDIEKDGHFSQSGIQLSDILIEIGDSPLIEPTDISSALARTSEHPFLITLVRGGRRIEVAITPGKSAGVTIAQLVAFAQVRL